MKTQKQIAGEIGISSVTISNWLNGGRIGRTTAEKISAVYGRDPGFWLFGDPDEIRAAIFFSIPINHGAGSNGQGDCS